MAEPPPSRPSSIGELLQRARHLAGRRIDEVASRLGFRVPPDLRGHKGFVGQLVELALGASAGSDPEPDFPDLGVELKTLPIHEDGRAAESTYVCVARVDGSESLDFRDSHVSRKLERVLFVPVVLPRSETLPLGERTFGMPFLWEPSAEDLARLTHDFRHLQMRIRLGESEDIRGREGEVMQLRPKAMSSRERTWGVSEEGWLVPVKPKAWYLRASFTSELIARVYGRTFADRS